MFQIASDLRFAIRITNRNRSQIARFGALSVGLGGSCRGEREKIDPREGSRGHSRGRTRGPHLWAQSWGNVGDGKPINKKPHKQDFHGIVPGLSRHFLEISWEFCLCVSLFPTRKATHKQFGPPPIPGTILRSCLCLLVSRECSRGVVLFCACLIFGPLSRS